MIDKFVQYIELPQPTLGNNTADAERLKNAIKQKIECSDNEKKNGKSSIFFPTKLVTDLPSKLRKWNHKLKVVIFKNSIGWQLIDIVEPNRDKPCFGIAADLGTTRIVLRLINLETLQACGEIGFDNPQASIAPDILARIHHARTDRGLNELQKLVISAFNEKINILCNGYNNAHNSCETHHSCYKSGYNKAHEADNTYKIDSKSIYILIVAGNSAMTHLFLGIDPSFLIREPYIPAINAPEPLEAQELGVDINRGGMVYLFPNIGSYFGGDLISGILFSELHKKDAPCIMVDVGTNAEVVVGYKDWLIACAGAAGPALEGGISDMGMTAKPGVIDKVKIDPVTGEIDIHTIEDKPPIGICGSGMIDLAAQLFLSGMIDIRGKFVPERCGKRFSEKDGVGRLIVAESEDGIGSDIVLSQVEMNSLTSSKAAMYSILQVIIEKTAGLQFTDLEKFYVAGTFGSFIVPKSAISIGMLPDINLEKFEVLGNSSLEGAAKLLTNPYLFDEIDKIREGITYIELNVNQEFMNIFSGAKFYPHTDISRFPSVLSYGA
ncbi:MAG: DUF4445 domain-containing protein [Desulfamplus sp.]|nr:DUF4445 domain-containing protein [Desulfamplus sp.]